MGCSSSGCHLLEIGSLKDSCHWLFSNEKLSLQKKHLAAKKAFGCKKSICLQKKHLTAKKAFACNFLCLQFCG
jgi:hypothetical protein